MATFLVGSPWQRLRRGISDGTFREVRLQVIVEAQMNKNAVG